MCKCRPEVRTPFCGRPGCEYPRQKSQYMGFIDERSPLMHFDDDVQALMWQESNKSNGSYLVQKVVLKVQIT